MRTLGIDFGKKRVGIAVSDPLGLTAQPLDVLDNNKHLIPKIKEICKEKEVSLIVLGLPKSLSGELNSSAQDVMTFLEKLKARTDIPVETYDERLSTSVAQQTFRQTGVSEKRGRSSIDKVAAAVILSGYLDRKRNGSATKTV